MREIISEGELKDGVRRLAEQLSAEYRGKPLTIVGILQDSIVLLGDLMRQMDIPVQMCIVHSRKAHFGPGRPYALDIDEHTADIVRGRDVVVVDDVLDAGWSLLEIICELDGLQPRSLRSAVLLRKQGQQEVTLEPDYTVFEIPNEVVVGYGLDCRGYYRNLPYIAALDPEDFEPSETVVGSIDLDRN